MTLEDYAAWAAGVARTPAGGTMDRERLSYLPPGLTGEAGEVAHLVKKLLRDGDSAWSPKRVAEELGDVIYCWSALCAAVGRKPGDVLTASKAKIEARIAKGG